MFAVGGLLRGCLNDLGGYGWRAALLLVISETGASPLCIAGEDSCRQTEWRCWCRGIQRSKETRAGGRLYRPSCCWAVCWRGQLHGRVLDLERVNTRRRHKMHRHSHKRLRHRWPLLRHSVTSRAHRSQHTIPCTLTSITPHANISRFHVPISLTFFARLCTASLPATCPSLYPPVTYRQSLGLHTRHARAP